MLSAADSASHTYSPADGVPDMISVLQEMVTLMADQLREQQTIRGTSTVSAAAL